MLSSFFFTFITPHLLDAAARVGEQPPQPRVGQHFVQERLAQEAVHVDRPPAVPLQPRHDHRRRHRAPDTAEAAADATSATTTGIDFSLVCGDARGGRSRARAPDPALRAVVQSRRRRRRRHRRGKARPLPSFALLLAVELGKGAPHGLRAGVPTPARGPAAAPALLLAPAPQNCVEVLPADHAGLVEEVRAAPAAAAR